ncbi:MAG: hypothetical protein AAF152_02105 [Cyanobacteria bacterium P01_A01_bin.114]
MAHHLGVKYTYAEAGEAASSLINRGAVGLSADRPRLTLAQGLAQMPQPWICRLHRAAEQIEAEQIRALIQQMPRQQSAIAAELSTLIENFDFDTIIELTEKIL